MRATSDGEARLIVDHLTAGLMATLAGLTQVTRRRSHHHDRMAQTPNSDGRLIAMEWLLIAIAVAGVVAYVMLQQRRPVASIPDNAEEFLALTLGGSGELFGDAPGVQFPGPRARTWAYGVLYEAGVDADADPSYAAVLLMKMQPTLTKADADALVRTML